MITGHTGVFAVIGSPVAHSDSPRLHNGWFVRDSLDAVYVALDIPADTSLLPVLRGLVGANLTIPHKQRVLPLLDEADDAVRATGAANTVTWRDGKLVGANTDVPGFARALGELNLSLEHRSVAVLGAGGAGRAVAYALSGLGVSTIHWLNRTVPRAREAASALALSCEVRCHPLDADSFRGLAPDLGLVVDATAGPALEVVESLDIEALPREAAWVDLNYWRRPCPMVERMRSSGRVAQEGDRMLHHQADLAFAQFRRALVSR